MGSKMRVVLLAVCLLTIVPTTEGQACPAGCSCGADVDSIGGTSVACIDAAAMPTSFPEGTTSILVDLSGYPGVPAGAVRNMVLCNFYLQGEVGLIASGAISNISAYDRCIRTTTFRFMEANITAINTDGVVEIDGFDIFEFERRQIGRLEKGSITNVKNVENVRFFYNTIGFIDDEALYGFQNIETFEFDSTVIEDYNVGNHGPFLSFRNIGTMKLDSLRKGIFNQHTLHSYMFSGLSDAVANYVFVDFEITEIEENAFFGVTNATSFRFEDCDILNIATNAFNGVSNVREIYFNGRSLTDEARIRFSSRAFAGMNNVDLIKFTDTTTDLADYNFADLTNLLKIEFQTSTIDEGDAMAFAGLDVGVLEFECSTLPNGTNAHWKFGEANRIGSLLYDYIKCPVGAEVWLDSQSFSGIDGSIGSITFNYIAIRYIDEHAFYDVKNVNEIVFNYASIDVVEPHAFEQLSNIGRIEFSHLKWDVFQPQTFVNLDNIDMFVFDDVDLGVETAILPADAFVDLDSVRLMRFNDFNTRYFSTRAFGWAGSSSGIETFEISNSSMYLLMSHAFHGLSNVGTFHFAANSVNCMETGAFMGMKDVTNRIVEDNVMPCQPIYDTPKHGNWCDVMTCLGQIPCPEV